MLTAAKRLAIFIQFIPDSSAVSCGSFFIKTEGISWQPLCYYGLAASAVAIGWSEYVNNFLGSAIGWQIPPMFRSPTLVLGTNGIEFHPSQFNFPPVLLVILCTFLLCRGTKESAKANAVLVAIAAVGAQPAAQFARQEAGLAVILYNVMGKTWPSIVLSAGAIISVFSVTLMTIYGQTRILYAVGQDALAPAIFQQINPRTLVPVKNTIIVSIVTCLYIIKDLPNLTFRVFALWIIASTVLYFLYGMGNSKLNAK